MDSRRYKRERRRRIRRRNRFIALVTAVVLMVCAAAAGKMMREGSIPTLIGTRYGDRAMQLGMVQKVKSLDPALIQERAGRLLGANIYEGLVGLDPKSMSPVPALAETWRISSDDLVYTFKLRRGVKFHSGRELKAEDVKLSWERVIDPAVGSGLHYLLVPIRGAREVIDGKAVQIEGIEVVGEYELKVTLEQPNASFLSRFAMPPFWVFDSQVLAAGKKTYTPGLPSAGTGPFILQEWKDKSVTLAANPDYWGRAPYITQAVFNWYDSPDAGLNAFKEGKLDYLDEVPTAQLKALEGDPSWSAMLVRQTLLDSYFYQINLQDPVWGQSLELRQALNYAINREALIDKLFNGAAAPLQSLVPQGFRGYKPPQMPYGYDPQKAAGLLESAGYPGGQGLPVLEIAYNELQSHKVVAEAVKEQLAQVGIKAQLKPVAWKDYKTSLAQGKFTCFRGGWSWDYPDPDDLFFYNFHSSQIGSNNFCFLKNSEVDNLLAAARLESGSDKKRFDYYQRAERIIIDEAPLIWLFSWQRVGMVSPEVQGLKINHLDLIPLRTVGIKE